MVMSEIWSNKADALQYFYTIKYGNNIPVELQKKVALLNLAAIRCEINEKGIA